MGRLGKRWKVVRVDMARVDATRVEIVRMDGGGLRIAKFMN